ncbi:hypothetical protein BGX38DRAFT_1157509 [Terfezia claveryi]|nr:hypothetical protein BGX38DRAFT_1157509 [Terfezia claveryi]
MWKSAVHVFKSDLVMLFFAVIVSAAIACICSSLCNDVIRYIKKKREGRVDGTREDIKNDRRLLCVSCLLSSVSLSRKVLLAPHS